MEEGGGGRAGGGCLNARADIFSGGRETRIPFFSQEKKPHPKDISNILRLRRCRELLILSSYRIKKKEKLENKERLE